MKVAQTPSPGVIYRFGLEAFARAFRKQPYALLVRHIHDGRGASQLGDCVHLPPFIVADVRANRIDVVRGGASIRIPSPLKPQGE